MMNPSAYLRKVERNDSEIASKSRDEWQELTVAGTHLRSTRELLPSGCILYRMTARKELQ